MNVIGQGRSILRVESRDHRDTFRKSSLNFFVDKIVGGIKDGSWRKQELIRRIKTLTFEPNAIDQLLLSILKIVLSVEYGAENGIVIYDNYISQREMGQKTYYESKRYFDVQSMLVALIQNRANMIDIERCISLSVDRVCYTTQCTYDSAWYKGFKRSTGYKIRCGKVLLENRPNLYNKKVEFDASRDSIIIESKLGNVIIENCMPTLVHVKIDTHIPSNDIYRVYTLTIHDMIPENSDHVDESVRRGINDIINTSIKEMYGIDEVRDQVKINKYGYVENGNLSNGNLIICAFDKLSSMLFNISNNLIALIVSIVSQNVRSFEAALIQKGYGYDFPTNLMLVIVHALRDEYESEGNSEETLYIQIRKVLMKGLANQNLTTGDSAKETTLALFAFGYAYSVVDRLINMESISENEEDIEQSLLMLDHLRGISRQPGAISKYAYQTSENLLNRLTNSPASQAEAHLEWSTSRICELLIKYNKSRWFATSNPI